MNEKRISATVRYTDSQYKLQYENIEEVKYKEHGVLLVQKEDETIWINRDPAKGIYGNSSCWEGWS